MAVASIENEKQIFKDLTHQLNNYNEIFNLNIYLKNTGFEERERLTKTNETLKSRIMKFKQEFVLSDRMKAYMTLKNNLMYYSIIVVSLLLVIVGAFLKDMISVSMLGTITGVVSVVFILSVILIVLNNADRKNMSWDQYYWGPMQQAPPAT